MTSDISPISFYEPPSKPSMMGAGLCNLGNTCFLNSVLQCFTHTVPLVESLRSIDHSLCYYGCDSGFCVFCALREQVEVSMEYTGKAIAPYKFVDNLNYISSSFERFQQEDAHEFLQCLLDKLDSCCLDICTKEQGLSLGKDSLVKKIFGGRLKSQLRCSQCGHCSDTFEPLIDLSLEIEDVDSLPSALESFTKVEKIEETKFTCENCKEEVLVEKQFTLDQTPLVAAFHLKRFKNDGSYVEKLDKHVEFPLGLDLQSYTGNTESDTAELKYELYAVVVHIGLSSCSGHYFCFIRSSPQTWHELDDSKVVSVTEEFVLSQEAYILFYAKQGTPWFSTLMETQKQLSELNVSGTSPKSVLEDMDVEQMRRETRMKSLADNLEMKVKDDVDVCPQTLPPSPPKPPTLSRCQSPPRCSTPPRCSSPPRSRSPIAFTRKPAGNFSIKRDHIQVVNHPWKTPANRDLEDSRRKEAMRLTRSMPSARASKLRAALAGGSQTEGPLNKRRRRTGCPDRDGQTSPSRPYRKLGYAS
ncbi:hypothetical protein GIB67_032525 [Kingdonia uniflora]|uniref:Ubiquitin carboxyl-terminal hydrolase n=1 Tax=Kingdonia uniflora TaxID=39325 RepID=A0A7J7L7M0_9MAGN|nr:hypothetical protein GIB67_032525 [Kingdonia uniflora]